MGTHATRVRASALNVRQQPSLSGARLGTVLRDQEYGLLERRGVWARIQFGEESGWLAKAGGRCSAC